MLQMNKLALGGVFALLAIGLGTAVVGWALALGLSFLLAYLLKGQPDFAGLAGAIYGFLGGYLLGVLLGLLVVRRGLHVQGSLRWGLVGVVAALAVTGLLSLLLQLNVSADFLLVVYLVLMPLLGAAGYLWRRKEV